MLFLPSILPPNLSLTPHFSQFCQFLDTIRIFCPRHPKGGKREKNMHFFYRQIKLQKIQLVAVKGIHHFYCREMVARLENEFYFYDGKNERWRAGSPNEVKRVCEQRRLQMWSFLKCGTVLIRLPLTDTLLTSCVTTN